MAATGNWWGTTDIGTIEGMIYDRNDDSDSASTIPFEPFLTAPDPLTPDPTPYLTRSASMCGIQTRAPLPTCNKLKKVLNTTNMYDFRNMVETFYHAEVSGCRLCLVGVHLVCEF